MVLVPIFIIQKKFRKNYSQSDKDHFISLKNPQILHINLPNIKKKKKYNIETIYEITQLYSFEGLHINENTREKNIQQKTANFTYLPQSPNRSPQNISEKPQKQIGRKHRQNRKLKKKSESLYPKSKKSHNNHNHLVLEINQEEIMNPLFNNFNNLHD